MNRSCCPRRHGRRRVATLLAAFVATLAIATGTAAAAKPVYGVMPQGGPVPGADELELMPEAGISSIRLMVHWGAVEFVPGEYYWKDIDAMIRETTNHGIRPLVFLYGIPEWVSKKDGRNCADFFACSPYPPNSRETRAGFADFAQAAVNRYGPGGNFWTAPRRGLPGEEAFALGGPCLPPLFTDCPPDPPPSPPPPPPSVEPPPDQAPCGCSEPRPIRVWQIWNEQNSPKYFAPKVDVKEYGKLLKSASKAIKQADKGAEVMLGGMWGPENAKNVVLPVEPYLKKLYKIKGIKKSFDSIAIHPYAGNGGASIDQVEEARKLLNRAGDRRVGIWVTEVGWASGGPPDNPYVKGLAGQAQLLSQVLGKLTQKRGQLKLRGIFWYSWRDLPGGDEICEWCGHAGLRAEDGSAKPAWDAFARVAK